MRRPQANGVPIVRPPSPSDSGVLALIATQISAVSIARLQRISRLGRTPAAPAEVDDM